MLTQPQTVEEASRAVGRRPQALAAAQLLKLIILGVGFWLVAALAVRFGAPAGFFGPSASLLAFGLAVPVCWLSVLFIKKVARLGAGQTLPGVAVGTISATFCDGIALTWGRGLYGTDPEQIIFGAAWILWGVGLFLVSAYLDDQRRLGASR